MPKTLTKNNNKTNIKKRPSLAKKAKRLTNNNSMKKELVFPLVVGIILGAMIMMFWQFSARLNSQNNRLAQLEQYASQNSQTINEVVNFINTNLGQQEGENASGNVVPGLETE